MLGSSSCIFCYFSVEDMFADSDNDADLEEEEEAVEEAAPARGHGGQRRGAGDHPGRRRRITTAADADEEGDVDVVFSEAVAEAREYISRNQRRKNRLVKNLDSAMDLNNYEEFIPSNADVRTRTTIRMTADRERGIPAKEVSWSSQEPPRGRRGPENLPRKPRALSEEAKAAVEPVQLWQLFFTEDMLNILVVHTNEKIAEDHEAKQYSQATLKKNPYLKQVDIVEMKALIGLMYMRGLLGANLVAARELWSGNYSPVFNAVMAVNRFCYLVAKLRTDDRSTRDARKRHDKFAACRELLDKFNSELAHHLQCGAWIVMDETLYPYRGSGFGFRIYMKGTGS